MESIWQRAFGQRMESICLEGICPEGFFWRAIVKEHLVEGFCLGEQVEPNLKIGLLNFGLAQKWLATKNLDYQIQIFQEGYFEL